MPFNDLPEGQTHFNGDGHKEHPAEGWEERFRKYWSLKEQPNGFLDERLVIDWFAIELAAAEQRGIDKALEAGESVRDAMETDIDEYQDGWNEGRTAVIDAIKSLKGK